MAPKQTFRSDPGRRQCEFCGKEFGARGINNHQQACPLRPQLDDSTADCDTEDGRAALERLARKEREGTYIHLQL